MQHMTPVTRVTTQHVLQQYSPHAAHTCSSIGVCAAVQLPVLELNVNQLTISIEYKAEVFEPGYPDRDTCKCTGSAQCFCQTPQ